MLNVVFDPKNGFAVFAFNLHRLTIIHKMILEFPFLKFTPAIGIWTRYHYHATIFLKMDSQLFLVFLYVALIATYSRAAFQHNVHEIDFFKPRKFDDFKLTAAKWTLFFVFAVFQALSAKKPVTVPLPYRVINQL